VYRWDDGSAIVQTVDFFTPIVDDPFVYGEIAAANALSDVYAMGGRPVTALAIAAFPKDGLERDVMTAIFRGGFETMRSAGVALLGGHTVQDPEIKFGYAVTGTIDPNRILTNGGARPGDVLFLTKPLGTGVIATAIKFGRVPEPVMAGAVRSMRTLNRAAAEAMLRIAGVSACTDITGFGFAGHVVQLAAASRVSLKVSASRLPLLEGAVALLSRNKTQGMATNKEHFARDVQIAAGVDAAVADLCYDPQTSGGLLIVVAAADAGKLAGELDRNGVQFARIGDVVPPGPARLMLAP
jgi:selenide,water dikinase